MRWNLSSLGLLLLLGCSATSTESVARTTLPTAAHRHASVPLPPLEETLSPTPAPNAWSDPSAALSASAERAAPGARRVLEATRAMLDAQTIVRGSCYRWVSAVYQRAGGSSHVAFRASREVPFADAAMLQPGDWVFFINHSYNDVTHSAIFVAWVDEPARSALMVSYAGGNHQTPGRFGEYELSNVYRLVRMGDAPGSTAATGRRKSPPRW